MCVGYVGIDDELSIFDDDTTQIKNLEMTMATPDWCSFYRCKARTLDD